jgi:hypothetical protein
MANRDQRRSFLRDAGLIAAGAVGGLAGGFFPTGAPAIEPVARVARSKFKFSLAAYSYRGLLSGANPKLTLDDFIRDCAQMGLEGTELTSYYFPKSPTPEYLRHLKRLAFLSGLNISGTAVGNDLCHPPGAKRDEQIQLVKDWVDYAEIMGASTIRIFSGKPGKDQSEAEAHKLAVEGMQECCDYAGKHGVFLALENHGGLTTQIDGLLSLVRDVKSPWFGVNLDTGNFQGCSDADQGYADMVRMAPALQRERAGEGGNRAEGEQSAYRLQPAGPHPHRLRLSRLHRAGVRRERAGARSLPPLHRRAPQGVHGVIDCRDVCPRMPDPI